MDKFKGTPGPWVVSGDTTKNKYGVVIFRIDNKDQYIEGLAEVCEGFTLEEGEANARLIAAAPELLEALQSCLYLIDELGAFEGTAITQAKSAIAKALGKEAQNV